MLVLSRKTNEQIVLDEQIVITVVAIRGDKVRIGIEAPDGVLVHRREVWEAIRRAELASPSPATPPSPADPS